MWPIRAIKPSDKNYITKTWVMSLRSQFPFSEMSNDAISKFSARIRALIGVAEVCVVYDSKNEDVVYGFCCYETGLYLGRNIPTLHFIWTRKALRQNGVATSLIGHAFPERPVLHYTHITRHLNNGNLRKKWRLESYDPYLIEGALFRDAKNIDARAIYWAQIPGQVSSS